ncbi:hypothetical protein vseg_010866 [Gypsophila vaccaria]
MMKRAGNTSSGCDLTDFSSGGQHISYRNVISLIGTIGQIGSGPSSSDFPCIWNFLPEQTVLNEDNFREFYMFTAQVLER